MAERVTVELIDDLDGKSMEGVASHSFALDRSTYEIDLSPANHEKLMKALAPFIAAARPSKSASRSVSPALKAGTRRRASSGAAASGVDPRAVRAWAAENGKDVPARGRVPRPIIEEYIAATAS